MMGEYLSRKASLSWNSMDKETKIENINFFLDIDNKYITQSDGIIYWNKKKKCIQEIFKWELNINIEDYLDSYSDGIYIYHGKPGDYILKTQAKYTNGIVEGMSSKVDPEEWNIKKSTNYLSSWNVEAPELNKIFLMTPISLNE